MTIVEEVVTHTLFTIYDLRFWIYVKPRQS
jgi:hypothetical protein